MKKLKKILYYSMISLVCVTLSACFDFRVPDKGDSDPVEETPDVPVNEPPSISGSPAASVESGSEYLFIPTSSDADGDALTFSITGRPGWLEFDSVTGKVWGTPLLEDADATYSDIVITVSDETDSNDISFSIDVIAPPPIDDSTLSISGMPTTQITVGQMYRFSPVAERTSHEVLSFSIENLPGWATFDLNTGILSGTPVAGEEGSYPDIRITVRDDNDGLAMLPRFDIAVLAVTVIDTVPVISGSPATVAYEDRMYQFIPTATDQDGDELTFSISNKPDWLTFDVQTGELSGTPSVSDNDLYQDIVISVSDDDSTVSLPSLAIIVRSTTVTLAWVAPTVRADGSFLEIVEIAGFRVYVGDSLGDMSLLIDINDPYAVEYVATNLEPGTRVFTVSAYDTEGLESAYSEAANIDI